MERHFAFFDALTGAYVREWKGDVPPPVIDPWLPEAQRQQALTLWATSVSGGQPGEIGLDVSQFHRPLGDFCWHRFNVVDLELEEVDMHRFVEVTPRTAQMDVNWASPRPVRSTPDKLIADITGTPWEAHHGSLFGNLVRRDGQMRLEPFDAGPRLLTEAPLDGALADMAHEVVPV